MLVIFSAFKGEAGLIIKLLNPVKKTYIGQAVLFDGFFKGKRILVCITGMGKKAAEEAARKVISLNKTGDIAAESIFLVAGICGASGRDLNISDIVFYESVTDHYFIDNTENDENDIKIKEQKKPEIYKNLSNGISIIKTKYNDKFVNASSVGGVVTKRKIKEVLSRKYKIDAFDMESFYIVKEAKKESIAVICVRSISDNLKYPVSELLVEFERGSKSKKIKTGLRIIFNPVHLKNVVLSIINIEKSLKSLNVFLANQLLPSLGYVKKRII